MSNALKDAHGFLTMNAFGDIRRYDLVAAVNEQVS